MINRLGGGFLLLCMFFFIANGQIGVKGKDLLYEDDPLRFIVVIFIMFTTSMYAIWRSFKKK